MEAAARVASDPGADEPADEAAAPALLLRPRRAVRTGHAVEAIAALTLLICCVLVYRFWLVPAEAEATAAAARLDSVLSAAEGEVESMEAAESTHGGSAAAEFTSLHAMLTVGVVVVVGLNALFALWSLWAVLPVSRRETLHLANGVLEWRPFIGRRRRLTIADLAASRERRRWWGGRRWELIPQRGPRVSIPPRLFADSELSELRRRVEAGVVSAGE